MTEKGGDWKGAPARSLRSLAGRVFERDLLELEHAI